VPDDGDDDGEWVASPEGWWWAGWALLTAAMAWAAWRGC
jgi:hypothetical protein